MRGVRRQTMLLFLVLCWIGSVRLADGVELSNMIFPSVAEQSREASARALEAVSTALRGIAEIERNRLDASRELLGKAVRSSTPPRVRLMRFYQRQTSFSTILVKRQNYRTFCAAYVRYCFTDPMDAAFFRRATVFGSQHQVVEWLASTTRC